MYGDHMVKNNTGTNADKKNNRSASELLTVAAEMYRDRGFGRATLTPKIQKRLGVKRGDAVLIDFDGKKEVAVVEDGYLKDRKNDYVRLDTEIRNLLEIVIGEQILVSKPKIAEAASIKMHAVLRRPRFIPVETDWSSIIKSKFANRYVLNNSKVNLNMGMVGLKMRVVGVTPKIPNAAYRITENTNIVCLTALEY